MATPVTAANFAIAGWGFGSAVSAVSGTQTRCTITITAGPSAIIMPNIIFTFPDGPFPVPPLSLARMVGGTGMYADLAVDNNAIFPASIAYSYTDLPVAGKTYVLMLDVLGV